MPNAIRNFLSSPRMQICKIAFVLVGFLTCAASAAQSLSGPEVSLILAQGAAYAAKYSSQSVLAVVDREGFVLGVLKVGTAAPSQGVIAGAVSRAGTAAFLSSNENAFTSRTAGYIIQQHFPPGIRNSSPGPLVGVGFSNLFFSDINRFKRIPVGFNGSAASTKSPGARTDAVPFTSLDDSPGGVPLYKNGELVGGVGVTGDSSPSNLSPAAFLLSGTPAPANSTAGFKVAADTDENVALAAQSGFRPSTSILATNVLLGGIRVPYVIGNLSKLPVPPSPPVAGTVVTDPVDLFVYTPQGSPASYDFSPLGPSSLGGVAGETRQLIRADPLTGTIGTRAAARLTAAEVTGILTLAAQRCSIIRAGIRLPVGTRAKTFITVVNNPNSDGVPPSVLGVFRVGEATLFSWDVSVQKARTAVFFSNKTTAMSTRAVGFLAQRFYPPGIDGQAWGPFFGLQEAVSLKTSPLSSLTPATYPGNPNLPNGMTIFPGGLPLYRNGELIGAIGVSGDGVDQDDMVCASGTANFLAADAIRSDTLVYRGARLPYVKFPRNPQ